ncbi:MAG: ATP-binding protein [Pseudomonadota bacterium]
MSTAEPANDTTWIAALAVERFKPLVVTIDQKGRISAVEGDARYFGYDGVDLNTAAENAFDFMLGLEQEQELLLDFLETPNGRSVHAYIQTQDAGRSLTLIDATQERDQRQALQQKSNELALLNAEQVKLLADLRAVNLALDEKRREAERLSSLQSQFLASMSHEFRTPLASILTYADYLSRDTAKIAVDDGLGSISRAAQHLLNMVENLIGQAQLSLEGIELNLTDVSVSKLVNELSALFAPLAAAKGLKLTMRCAETLPQMIKLDAIRFKQICINLLGNACKYTEHGSITLEAKFEDGMLEVSVRDTGVGISADAQARIFEAFERGERQDNKGGAGLGLHITQRLVTLMDGTIDVQSQLGEGTCITIRAPVESIPPTSCAPPAQESTENKPSRPNLGNVVVVEDDTDVYDILEIYLDEAGYEVYHADSGLTALDIVAHSDPVAVISDLNVPEIDGVELTQALRGNDYQGPIIVLTASDLRRDRQRAMLAGCTEYVVKPISPEALTRLLITHGAG